MIKSIRTILIQPPNIGGVRSLHSHMNEEGESIGFKPPLGLLSIATLVKERGSHKIAVLDAWAKRLGFDECVNRVAEYRPDIIGISAWTDWWYAACHLGILLKERLPGTHLCYGGPHVNIFPEETLSFAHSDSIVTGDGEEPFAHLCDMIAEGAVNNDCAGLHFKRYGVKKSEKRFYIQKDLDMLPIPDRTLLPLKDYTSVLGSSDFITTMITSRGCPYRCIYCKLNYQKTLVRSAANVIGEFKKINELGIKEVEVYDDTFTWSKERALKICEGLIDEKINIKWAVRDRVNMADDELLGAMKRAGCHRIHYGVESGVDRVLTLMKKNITVSQARNAVRMAKKNNFTVLTYFMMGNKGENEADIKQTIDFSLELDADYAQFSITIPYPGTEMYLEALRNGIIKNDYWREFALRPSEGFRIPRVYEENITLHELIRLRNEAIRRYYTRPKYILREISRLRSFPEFKRKAVMALRLFTSLVKNSSS